jgi:uncharacterized protein (AIM24 family)/thioredoxin-like negative regulator of GroEL
MATRTPVSALEEEFQRLLAQGSQALARGELEPAREALENALAIRSRDSQVLGLLGQVFYRLARYGDAAIAWQRLVDDNPVEPGARVNLGLAWLKAREFEAAIKQLRIALDLNPDHRKAAGYLGLAWLEMGNPAQAREYFVRSGSEQLVARCDQLLAAAAPQPPEPVAPESSPAEAPGADAPLAEQAPTEQVAAEQVAASIDVDLAEPPPVESLAVEAAPPEAEPVQEPSPLEPTAAEVTPTDEEAALVEAFARLVPDEKSPVAWRPPRVEDAPPRQVALELESEHEAAIALEAPMTAAVEAGMVTPEPEVIASGDPTSPEPDAPPLAPPASPEVASTMPTLAGFAASRAVQGPAGQVFVADGATLTVNVRGELLCRLAGLAAWRGELAFAGEVKRFRGQATDKPFGEAPEQMHRLVGDGLVVLRAAGRRFTVLELGGEAGYFREAVVFGFQEQVAFENGRLPSPSGGLDLVHLRGTGRLVLVTRGEPVAVEVTRASPVHVPLGALVGWTGALSPRISPLFAGGLDGEAVEISGEGRVLVDPGPSTRPGDGS